MFAPLFVEGDDFIDEFDVSETTALRFANDFRIYSEKLYIQHFEFSLFSTESGMKFKEES